MTKQIVLEVQLKILPTMTLEFMEVLQYHVVDQYVREGVTWIELSRGVPLRNNRKQYHVNNRTHYATKHRRIASMAIESRTRMTNRNSSSVVKSFKRWQRTFFVNMRI